MSEHLFIGVDVGGQSIKAGVITDAGQPLSRVAVPTESAQGQEHGLEQICKSVVAAADAAEVSLSRIQAIGVATPGTMDIPAGIILDPPNLRPWKNVPVRDFVQRRFGKPCAFQNDANAAAYGEYWCGAGKGAESMVLFTLGTGIGGGIILNDRIVEGQHSHGAELGHIIIEMTHPRICGCGGPGHLEAYASAIAIGQRTTELLRSDSTPSLLRKILDEKGDVQPEDAGDVFQAAAAGDSLAEKIIEETAYYLAVGTTSLMHTIDPSKVVFGGGMIRAGDSFLHRIRRHVKRIAFPVPAERTPIVYAELGNDAGFIGVAGCARQLFRQRVG